VRRIHHIGIRVAQLPRALVFYRDPLGMNVIGRRESRWWAPSRAFARVVDLDAGNGQILELLEYGPENRGVRLDRPHTVGSCNLSLEVVDLDGALARLARGSERAGRSVCGARTLGKVRPSPRVLLAIGTTFAADYRLQPTPMFPFDVGLAPSSHFDVQRAELEYSGLTRPETAPTVLRGVSRCPRSVPIAAWNRPIARPLFGVRCRHAVLACLWTGDDPPGPLVSLGLATAPEIAGPAGWSMPIRFSRTRFHRLRRAQ
jgi:catechol 2,3-dioxygenase-like lactoylglutathione lyase family enzyme